MTHNSGFGSSTSALGWSIRGQSQECALNGPLLPGIIPPPSNMLVCSRITEYDGGISSIIWETRKALIHRSGRNPA